MSKSLEALLDRAVTEPDIQILEQVDEYTLYCHYLEFEPQLRTRYRSVIRSENERADSSPSFSIFISDKFKDREYIWKDLGLGTSGDIFKLVMLLYDYGTKQEAWDRVAYDFGLSDKEMVEEKIVRNAPPDDKPPCNIKIESRPFTKQDMKFWNSFGIGKEQLDRYFVKAIKYYWMSDFQSYPLLPQGLAYSYEVLQKYKIYQPFAPKYFKFRNSLTERCLEGFAQLKYKSDLLIITKSTKDIMTLDALGYEAVSPRGENVLVPTQYLRYLHTKYKRILILFDNDMKHKGDEYNERKIYIPLNSGQKDISDYRKAFGREKSLELMKQLTV